MRFPFRMVATLLRVFAAIVVVLGAGAGGTFQGAEAEEVAAKAAAGPAASGTAYYIDFAGGRDSNDGRTPGSAFQRCPGDTEATGNAQRVKLSPGDKLVFKGGIEYRGTVTVASSGQEGKPIVYDGNTEGKFGSGKAIIQGGEPVTGWKKVASADEVEGNPHWQNLYSTYLTDDRTFFNFGLYEGDRYLAAAQDPKPEDPFFYDRVGSYRSTPTVDGKSLTDPNYFTSSDPNYYAGAYVALHVQPNYVACLMITGYDPAQHKVTFRPFGDGVYGGRRGQLYALMNSLKILSRPGEYYLDEKHVKDGKLRLVVWPHKPGPQGPENVTITSRTYGFLIPDANHVVIDGFKICYQGGRPKAAGIMKPPDVSNTDLVIRNNEVYRVWGTPSVNVPKIREMNGAVTVRSVTRCLVENNSIYENRRMGILGVAFDDSICRGNYLRRNGSTAASFHTCQHSKILDNIVWDNLGIHANGLTVYLGSDDVLVEGNEVYNSNDCLTLSSSSNVTVRRNILDAHGLEYCIAIWVGQPMKNVRIENNVLVRAAESKAGILDDSPTEGLIIRNNIVDGIAGGRRRGIRGDIGHNLWTSKGRNFPGEKPGDVFESDLRKIFVDPDRHDYRLRPGSPAIDAGAETTSKADFAGTPVPQGKAPDIGAYEHMSNGPRYRPGHAGRLAPPIEPSPAATKPSH